MTDHTELVSELRASAFVLDGLSTVGGHAVELDAIERDRISAALRFAVDALTTQPAAPVAPATVAVPTACANCGKPLTFTSPGNGSCQPMCSRPTFVITPHPAAPKESQGAVADEVDLWCFLRDVLKRGASIESQFSQQGYETFISEIEAAARKEDGRLRAMLAASTTEERDPYASHSHDEAIAAAHADGKIKFTPPGPITGVWIDEATEPSKEGE